MPEISEVVKVSDGFGISCRRWTPSFKARGVIACIPGTSGNSEFFRPIGNDLASNGFEVFGIDLRGFGNSVEEGLQRGDTRSFRRHLQDLEEVMRHLRDLYPTSLMMMGHSHGCAYVLWYSATHGGTLDGLILAAPPVTATTTVPKAQYLKFALALALRPRMMYSFGEETNKVLADNPLMARSLSIRWLYGSKKYLLDPLMQNARRVQEPALILQGTLDMSTLATGAKDLLDALGSKDKILIPFPGADHFLFGAFFPTISPDGNKSHEVSTDVVNWINSRTTTL